MDNSYDLTPKMNMVRFLGNLIELEGRIMKIRTLSESASRELTVLVIVRAVTNIAEDKLCQNFFRTSCTMVRVLGRRIFLLSPMA